jgi:DedD protein
MDFRASAAIRKTIALRMSRIAFQSLYFSPVDKYLKERLVGAAVLVAAAIILIPEMLSGPKDNVSAPVELPAQNGSDPSGLKTYTIDLSAPKSAPAQANREKAEQSSVESPAIVETVPPPKEIPSDGGEATQGAAAQKSSDSQLPRERDRRLLDEFTAQEKPATHPTAKAAEKSEKALSAATPPPATAVSDKAIQQNTAVGGWSVQVASFSVRATSERLSSDLKSKGYPAFVATFTGTGQTMYRVRVGPVADRPAAETLLKKIKPLYPDANVAAP